jgi:hypothetical protein
VQVFSHPIQSAMANPLPRTGPEGPALRSFDPLSLDRSSGGLPADGAPAGGASLLALAPPGKIVELSGQARTSLAARLLRAVQAEGEPVAWVTPRAATAEAGGLFPPDLAAAGLDLDALVVVHIAGDAERMGPKAAELLLRTGAFGAVAIDARALGRAAQAGQRATAWQGRLLGILRSCEARLLLLSDGDAASPSLGPLVAVRLALVCERHGEAVQVTTQVLKDKSGALGERSPPVETWRGPPGSASIETEPAAPSGREPTGATARPRLVRLPLRTGPPR